MHPARDVEPSGADGSCEDNSPKNVYKNNFNGETFERCEVGEVVCGVGEETEERTVKDGVFHGVIFHGWEDGKDEDANDVNEVENDGCGPVDVLFEEVAQVLPVELFGHEAEPREVDGEEDKCCEEVAQNQFHDGWFWIFLGEEQLKSDCVPNKCFCAEKDMPDYGRMNGFG